MNVDIKQRKVQERRASGNSEFSTVKNIDSCGPWAQSVELYWAGKLTNQ